MFTQFDLNVFLDVKLCLKKNIIAIDSGIRKH